MPSSTTGAITSATIESAWKMMGATVNSSVNGTSIW
jgi:hypothetical protein